ncbi:hypothetical protein QBC46DRAFT_369758 [Diplogelasinospora grovesii]|uniref:Uncharacterized protein n=1 Tax=Diplogelasinospora grovesii TaxID=303347 RepID=A0AAN6SAV4_9PEZI|nr:hypothetical protein QBC46DRAFT_369758 [Diplogelasinospora grovesii]
MVVIDGPADLVASLSKRGGRTSSSWTASPARSMVGIISPSLNLEEAHGFYDAQIISGGQLSVEGSGVLEIDGTLPISELYDTDGITDYGWGQPGLVSFKPTLNTAVQMSGSGRLSNIRDSRSRLLSDMALSSISESRARVTIADVFSPSFLPGLLLYYILQLGWKVLQVFC